MERWSGRVALVTGASAGIGAVVVRDLVKHGMVVVGFARREEKIKELADELEDAPGKLYAYKGDVSKEEDVLSVFSWAKENLGGIDVLINNAGVLYLSNLHESSSEDWRNMLEVNILGFGVCMREAINGMREREVDDGYIINIGSIAGQVPAPQGFLMYSATKHAVRVLNAGIRKELEALGSRIRVSSVSPGVVKTELFDGLSETTKDLFLEKNFMLPEDISEVVIFILSTPERVQIQEVILHPTGAAF